MPPALTRGRFPFVAHLSSNGRAALEALVVKRVGPRREILQRGEPADGAYLVVGGALRVFYVTAAGREATLYHVGPGSTCVLALTATFASQPYPAWVAAGPAGGEVVRVPSALFLRLFDGEAPFREFVLGALSGRIFELMCALEETGSVLVEQRVARYLLRRRGPGADVRVSQSNIAADLGTAREVVQRALRALAARRLVATGRLRVRILDADGLEAAARDDAPAPE